MKLKYIDTHTMGEPTRIIIEGIPPIPGSTMIEKKKYLEKNFDYIRTMAMHEPRGHRDMFGAVITEPSNQDAHVGVIFMDGGGYLNMCCHGSMGVSTMLIEKGFIEAKEPITYVKLDTPAGLIEVKAKVDKKKVQEVSIINVPSFLYKNNIKVEVPTLGEIPLDIAFGGSFFALVNAKDIGIRVSVDNVEDLVKYGLAIRQAVNENIDIVHPTNPFIDKVDLVEIYDEPTSNDADLKNVVIFGKGQIDRSPCGTGTSAKLATLYAKRKIRINEPFVYESIAGTKFIGKVLKETKVGTYDAIIPEITGKAFIINYGYLVAEEEDMFKYGFVL
ncbi:proline racemase [Keratinibaculum paraultunense]|uniref:Proline racemase n=1 Tax=Keratinibaculum paraultunense TaxID=1278232 RepID=A0A4R3L144_9FIRM|nr:proline racemase family protein [Keratinibaculum paraultunense]QQY80221.1 proline racemase family protein [Keratinibaculum paraultunense]TCS90733.1 proline racemase [Keratinibaculum paraultunense]